MDSNASQVTADPGDGAGGAERAAERDPLEVFEKGLAYYQEKYFRTAFMIAKNAAGLAGINDQIPEMDDLQRSRLYYEEVRHACEVFRAEGTDAKWRRVLR